MLQKFLFVMLCFTTLSCREIGEKDFKTFTSEFLQDYAALFPDETPLSKDNQKLAFLALPTPTYFDSLQQFHRRFDMDLKSYDVHNSAFPYKGDVKKMENILKNVATYLSDYHKNPVRYNVLHGFKRVFEAQYAPNAYRLQTIFNKLDKVPAFYEAAKKELMSADRPLADEAVEQQIQTFLFFDETLTTELNKAHLMTPQYLARIDEAKLAVKDYVAFVESFRVQ